MLRFVSALTGALVLAATSAAAQTPSAAERAQALELYRHIVQLDTSVEGARTPEAAAYLAEQFRADGIPAEDIHVLPHGATAALLFRYRGDGSGGRPILLLGHLDVVPAHRSDWERDPFTLVEENGFFFGRGSLDNKAGVANIASTVIALRREGFRPTRDLIVWFSGDEETSGETTRELLSQHRDLIADAEFALNSDAGGGQLSEAGAPLFFVLQTAEKTYASFTFTARNPGGHSSAPRADNAIYDLADALERLRAFQFPVMWNDTTIGAFRASAAVTTGEEGAAMLRFAENPGDRRAARILSANPHISTLMRTTCVATMLAAGHAENALPQSATATVNCRIFPGVQVASVQAELQRIAGAGVTVAPIDQSFASDASPLRADVMSAVTHAAQARVPSIPVAPYMEAGATDGVFFRSAGIPTYGVGGVFIRSEDEFSHGLNERVPVESFYGGLTHWRVLLTTLAGPN